MSSLKLLFTAEKIIFLVQPEISIQKLLFYL